MGIQNANAVKY